MSQELAQLMAIAAESEDDANGGHPLTEQEIREALDSPSILETTSSRHPNTVDTDDDRSQESTECDDHFDAESTTNRLSASDGVPTGLSLLDGEPSAGRPPKAGEYQFQMMEHHIFKGKHGKKLYKCDICSAVYRHSFSLKRHFIRSHINYGYLCDTDVTNCGINLLASASLQEWRQQCIHNPLDTTHCDLPELYCCHSCVLFFDDLPQIKAHVDDCHRNNSSGTIEPIRIPCGQCNMSFIQRHNLVRHVEVVHCGKRLYGCKHCSKKFQTIADRKKHEKAQHHSHSLDYSPVERSPSPPPVSMPHPTTQKSATSSHRPSHKCLKCSQLLPTYSELRKHVIKHHKEFYYPCGYCNKFHFMKKQLTEHLRQKHNKTCKENTEKLRMKRSTPGRPPNALREQSAFRVTANTGPLTGHHQQQQYQQLLQQNQCQAYFHCSLCYRRFLTYGSLIRHKQVAHRTQHVRNCSRLTTDTQMDRDYVEPRVNALEFEFYQSLAQRVAENLLYFVDGKSISNPSNDYHRVISNPTSHTLPTSALSGINLSQYNFPEDYRRESSPTANVSTEKLEFMFDCNLNTVKNPKFEPPIIEQTASVTEAPQKPQFICTACHQKVSADTIAEHEANNHPNVYSQYIEVEPMNGIPSQLLLWQYHCSEGLLHRCPPAPSLTPRRGKNDGHNSGSDTTTLCLKCTKCQKLFESVANLHNHILECAHNHTSKKAKILSSGVVTAGVANSHKQQSLHETSRVDISTQTIANTSATTDTTITSNLSTTTIDTIVTDTAADTSVSSNATEKMTEFSSPLSPSKTRSGKRRQIGAEERMRKKRRRRTSKNELMRSQKSTTDSDGSTFKPISVDNNDGSKATNKCLADTDSTITTDKSVNKDKDLAEKATPETKLPKRYSCKKCTTKFVYMDTLSKHQMSCKKVFNSATKPVDTSPPTETTQFKRTLRQSTQCQQKATNFLIEFKKFAKRKNAEKRGRKAGTKLATKRLSKSDSKVIINEDTEEELEITSESKKVDEDDDEGTECEGESQDRTPVDEESISVDKTGQQNASKSETEDILEEDGSEPLSLDLHKCPDCDRIFTYMANFRKHIKKVCPKRQQSSTDNSSIETMGAVETPLTSTPLPNKSCEELSHSDVIVVKQETLEIDCKDSNNNSNNDNSIKGDAEDDVVFDGECKADGDDVLDPSILIKDESKLDLFRVKQENPKFAFKGSPAQHHSCPYCQRGFTYLANYRKHIKTNCPIRQQIDDKKSQSKDDHQEGDEENSTPGAPKPVKTELPPPLVYTPSSLSVRSQIEDTVLTLLRDQTKQDQILQSSEQLVKAKSAHKTDEQLTTGDQQSVNQSGDDSKTDNSAVDNTKDDELSDKMKDNNKESTQLTAKTTPTKGSFRFRTFSCNICHKIFLSYVTMLKHSLSHKLSDGSAAAANALSGAIIDDTTISSANDLSDNTVDDELVESNRSKEAANQALAVSILNRSKEIIFNKTRANATVNRNTGANACKSSVIGAKKQLINTTDLLEKLARGGITTDAIQELSAATVTTRRAAKKSNISTKAKEVITIETNNNDSQTYNLQLSGSTSGNNHVNSSAGGVEEIIIDANHLNDLGLNVLKDGVIVAQDLQQLIAANDGLVTAGEDDGEGNDGIAKCPEVLLNLDDIENANEVWITITDSSALIQVPNHNTGAKS